MATGVVKFFNGDKGFGFIKQDDEKGDIFFHKNQMLEAVAQDDKVTFDIGESKKGKTAINVKRLK